jgi:hypothetical protein
VLSPRLAGHDRTGAGMTAILFEQPYRGDLWRLEVATHEGRTFGNWRKWYRDGDTLRPTRQGVIRRGGSSEGRCTRHRAADPWRSGRNPQNRPSRKAAYAGWQRNSPFQHRRCQCGKACRSVMAVAGNNLAKRELQSPTTSKPTPSPSFRGELRCARPTAGTATAAPSQGPATRAATPCRSCLS